MCMVEIAQTVADRIKTCQDRMTRSERQISNVLLENYPASGLGSINTVAERGSVSTPTIVRFVKKLGFEGFPEFQACLRSEVEAMISNPIKKKESWVENVPEGHILNKFSDTVVDNINQTLQHINFEHFERACQLISNSDYPLFLIGGRISRTLADYMFLHLQVMRKNVTYIQPISNAWPHYLLEIENDAVMVIFDIRRYENSTLKLAEIARERNAKIILITDEWQSPIEKYAEISFCTKIVVPSAWDSLVAPLLLTETIIAAIQEINWSEAKGRMEELEEMFDRTKFFRKFV